MDRTFRIILVSGVLLLALAVAVAMASPGDEPAATADWVFIYYMSYDNNLSGYSEIILQQLSHGLPRQLPGTYAEDAGQGAPSRQGQRAFAVVFFEQSGAESRALNVAQEGTTEVLVETGREV